MDVLVHVSNILVRFMNNFLLWTPNIDWQGDLANYPPFTSGVLSHSDGEQKIKIVEVILPFYLYTIYFLLSRTQKPVNPKLTPTKRWVHNSYPIFFVFTVMIGMF